MAQIQFLSSRPPLPASSRTSRREGMSLQVTFFDHFQNAMVELDVDIAHAGAPTQWLMRPFEDDHAFVAFQDSTAWDALADLGAAAVADQRRDDCIQIDRNGLHAGSFFEVIV